MISRKPHILLMGQTPPPWHGQAVATQILFEHEWPDFDIHRLRMEFSEEMLEVGRFQWRKVWHLFHLITKARRILKDNPGCILFYPPASAKWIPFLRDIVFLSCVRHFAGGTVFIFHASGLPSFSEACPIRRLLSGLAYRKADFSLEVAQEAVPAHEVFDAKDWQWCPCAIEVPDLPRHAGSPEAATEVLFVASLQEGKGVLEILKTANVLKKLGRENDFRFRIVGKWFSEDFEEEARRMHADFGLGLMVEFVGQLIGDQKWVAYAKADIFFFPSHYESEATPIVLMEALGMGLPVVSTQWAGIPAMLDGCSSARILPVRSPEKFADALIELGGQRDQSGENARISKRFYEDRFLPERFIDRVAKAVRAVHDRRFAVSQVLATPAKRAPVTAPSLRISAYLADQNPGYDRSFGISRMSQVVLDALKAETRIRIEAITSKTSQQAPDSVDSVRVLPWGTRRKFTRILSDHFHPWFGKGEVRPDLHYFPKGYLPLLSIYCKPSVVTIHDTIIQYDEDHYPKWRKPWEYAYWSMMLRHTLKQADRIMTVSVASKRQITAFMERHGIPEKEIFVTYEPCLYERLPQPLNPLKENYVIHLASCEPHKRTAQLVRWWHEAESGQRSLPTLHLIGTVPPEVSGLLASARGIVKRPFLSNDALIHAYVGAKALILPSEIEGFGLPALEAYYLGTPVCFVENTSVEEILSVATSKGRFSLESSESLFRALDEVMEMPPDETRDCGLKLRETYASARVAKRMLEVFQDVMERQP
jgi:glycosyltransferase involved in cell wall biosynthesis